MVSSEPNSMQNNQVKLAQDKYIAYIKDCRKKGFADDYIRKSLLDKGWPEQEINNAFNTLNNKMISKKEDLLKKEVKNKAKK